jgi:hypothetical protein
LRPLVQPVWLAELAEQAQAERQLREKQDPVVME